MHLSRNRAELANLMSDALGDAQTKNLLKMFWPAVWPCSVFVRTRKNSRCLLCLVQGQSTCRPS